MSSYFSDKSRAECKPLRSFSDKLLGTNANFAADMTLAISVVVAILFTVGMVMAFHALTGFFGLTVGLFVVLRANNLKLIPKPLLNNYKLFMRVSYALYMLATLLGIWVYLTWFVTIPNPPTF